VFMFKNMGLVLATKLSCFLLDQLGMATIHQVKQKITGESAPPKYPTSNVIP